MPTYRVPGPTFGPTSEAQASHRVGSYSASCGASPLNGLVATVATATSKTAQNPTLAKLSLYYETFKTNSRVAAFAFQLYSIAFHWFTISKAESAFIDGSFAAAANDVFTNPTYSSAPSWINRHTRLSNSRSLGFLGTQHLNDHIKPTYKQCLSERIEAFAETVFPFEKAAENGTKQLKDEHEAFLTTSIPYGISQLVASGLLESYQSHYALSVQIFARKMRREGAAEIFASYVNEGKMSFTSSINAAKLWNKAE